MCVFVSRSIMSDSMTPWNVACQAPLSMEFSRQGYRRGLPFPSPGGLPNPETEPGSPALQAYALPSELKFLNSRHEGKSYKFPKRKIKLFLKWKDETCVRLLICTHTPNILHVPNLWNLLHRYEHKYVMMCLHIGMHRWFLSLNKRMIIPFVYS